MNKPERIPVDIPRAKYLRDVPDFLIPDEISILYPEKLCNFYRNGIRSKLRLALVEGLRNTERWVNCGNNYILPPDFNENDLDHVKELLYLLPLFKKEYPDLYNEVTDAETANEDTLRLMFTVHDIGETIRGDVSAVIPDDQKSFHKKMEASAARKLMHLVSDPEIKKTLLDCLHRFESKDENDKLVQFGHLIDKFVASYRAAKVVIPYNYYNGDFSYRHSIEDKIEASAGFTLKHSDALSRLVSDKARASLRDLIEEQLIPNYAQLSDERVDRTIARIRSTHPTFDIK